MGIDKPGYVFNLDALLFGGFILVLVILVHAILSIAIHEGYNRATGYFMLRKKYFRVQIVFLVTVFLLMIPHLVEIGLWGAAIHYSGLVKSLHDAIIFSGSSYTTLGFAPNVFPPGWELVTVIIAVSGMFAFAWSTALMMGMVKDFREARVAITNELEAKAREVREKIHLEP